ncbi:MULTISPECIES: polyprenyl synthetase family protein [unclassified Treponema]|uniref:polyprenyl synthetase family protein n=1 Tax=unclassified Treponema TaxID=2638727 RepID=UPI0020A2F882|nr:MULTISPECIES: polyprenyl synthetase family protein [unclassified Treponema]UTC68095.1 polyprenyl synthetase family protein [Treponema sp. OMZ 789]UTC70817.1 polyprenyl synthetase family protein [Treponema sp. OMZ 790]UTC73557.1 polyprenyl synthetase family protein [Treponema sp. OMZ 791]
MSELKKRLENIEKTLDLFLPENVTSSWISQSFGELNANLSDDFFLNIINPVRDLVKRGGKRWRPLLCVLSCELAEGDPEKAYPLTPLIEFCHTASLVHDDIEDKSETRRGAPAAHIKYGLDTALNSASWLYFEALNPLINYKTSESVRAGIYSLYSQNLRRLHLGQSMDIGWHSNPDIIPSIDQYITMISLKTGSLAKLAGELGFIAADKSMNEVLEYGKLMTDMGIGFQILDDVKNITEGNAGKKRGDDIIEGKKSLPVIFYAEENPQGAEKIKLLFKQAAKEGIDSPAVEECISAISSSRAVKRAEDYGKKIVEASLIKLQNNYKQNEAKELIFDLFNMILR